MRRRLAALLLTGAAVGLLGCDPPCQSLAQEICNCEPNRTEQDVCFRKLQIRGDLPTNPEEEMACSALLETCTCEALAREDLAACGLSRPQ